MSLTIPGRRRSHPKHRASDKVRELTHRQTAADAYFKTLRQDIADMHTAWKNAERAAANAEDLVALQAVNLQNANGRVAELEAQLAAQTAELNELRAFKATVQAVTVPPMVRDTRNGADQNTTPIDVSELQARFTSGPVVRLHHSPQAVPPAA